MNYYDRCVKRIEEAEYIEFISAAFVSKLTIALNKTEHLVFTELCYSFYQKNEIKYMVSFKGIDVPLDQESANKLFSFAQAKKREIDNKLEEIEKKKNEEILKEL